MKLIGQLVAVGVGLAVLGAMGVGVYLAIDSIMALFASLDGTLATVTGIACLVVLVSALSIERAITAAGRDSRATALRDEKTQTYQLLLDVWTTVLVQRRAQTPLLQSDLSAKVEVVDRLLAAYGSAPVIRAHMALRKLTRDEGRRHPDVKGALGRVMVAVREDLGTNASSVTADELERLVLPARETAVGIADAGETRLGTAAV